MLLILILISTWLSINYLIMFSKLNSCFFIFLLGSFCSCNICYGKESTALASFWIASSECMNKFWRLSNFSTNNGSASWWTTYASGFGVSCTFNTRAVDTDATLSAFSMIVWFIAELCPRDCLTLILFAWEWEDSTFITFSSRSR